MNFRSSVIAFFLVLALSGCGDVNTTKEVIIETDLNPNNVLKFPFVYKLDGDRGYVIDTLQKDGKGNFSTNKKYSPGLYRAILNREFGIEFIDDSLTNIKLSLSKGEITVDNGYATDVLYKMKRIISDGENQWEQYMKKAEASGDVNPDLLDSLKAENRRKLVDHVKKYPDQISSLLAFSYINVSEHKSLFDSVARMNDHKYGNLMLTKFYKKNYERLSNKDVGEDN